MNIGNNAILILGLVVVVIAYFLVNGFKKIKEQKALDDQKALEQAMKDSQQTQNNTTNNTTTSPTATAPKAKSFSQIFTTLGLQSKLQDANDKYSWLGVKVPTTKNGLYTELAKYGLNRGDTIILD